MHGLAVLVAAAGGAWEELVPGAEQRAGTVDVDLVRLAAGDQLADRPLDHDRLDGGEERGLDALLHRQRRVAQRVRRGEQQVAVGALGGAAAHALQQPRADLEVVGQLVRALPGLELDGDGVSPGRPRVAPGVDPEGPQARLVRHDRRGEAVDVVARRGHPDVHARPVAADLLPHDVGRDRVVALAPDRGADRHDLADDRLAGMVSVAHVRRDVVDTQPTGHQRTPWQILVCTGKTVPTRSGRVRHRVPAGRATIT